MLLSLCEGLAKEHGMHLSSVVFLCGRVSSINLDDSKGNNIYIDFDDRTTHRTFVMKEDNEGNSVNIPYDSSNDIWNVAERILNEDDLWFIKGTA